MESLGDRLKSVREAKGWTLDYISGETNISSRYLDALEREDFPVFPGEAYALGFLKNYGEYLGIDPEELYSLYNSLRIREQPVPVEQLLKRPSPFPKIAGWIALGLVIAAVIGGLIFFLSRLPKSPEAPPPEAREVSEYVLDTDFLERRFYPGDSVLVTESGDSYKLIFSNLGDAITITTPRGPVMLDLGQALTVDLNNDGFAALRIIAADFAKNDAVSGALLRFEQETPPQTQTASAAAESGSGTPAETPPVAREAAFTLFSSPNAFPFTLQAVFQGYCLFRYEILFERDRPGRNEQYYQRSEELNIQAQNGIRLGISNAQAARFQVIGGGRTMPLEVGGAGEVVAAELRWIRDEENQYRLVLLRLE